MDNAPEKNFSQLLVGKFGKSTKQFTHQCHYAKEGKYGLEAEHVHALRALRGIRSKIQLVAERWWEIHFLSNEEKEKWIEDYVERETAGARKRAEDTQAAVQQEQEDMKNAENTGLMNREPEKTFQELMVAIGDSLSDLARSNNWEDGEDMDDEEIEQGKLTEADESGWVMGTITKTVKQCMERFWQEEAKLKELSQPGWDDAVDYFRERDMKHCTSELRVSAVVQPQMDDVAVAPALTSFGELWEYLDNVPRILHMPQGNWWPRRSPIRLGSPNPRSNTHISSLVPADEPDSSPLLQV